MLRLLTHLKYIFDLNTLIYIFIYVYFFVNYIHHILKLFIYFKFTDQNRF